MSQGLWSVPKEWPGETAFLIAGGPSVTAADLAKIRHRRVVVVNSSYIAAPWADYLIFTDLRWWKLHRNRVYQTFGGRIVTLTPVNPLFDGVSILERRRCGGLSEDPTTLTWWHTTVLSAINLMVLLGVARIGILGLDGQDDKDGNGWHHEPHPLNFGRNPNRYGFHGTALSTLVAPLQDAGVECFNLNSESTHKMFPFATLDELLA